MAIFDTHKAYRALTAGGVSEAQAQTLVETLGDSRDALATKADLHAGLRDLEPRMVKYQLGIAGATVAMIVALLKLLPV